MDQVIIDRCGRPIENRLNADSSVSVFYLGSDAFGAEIFHDNAGDYIIVDGEKRYWRSIPEPIDTDVFTINFHDCGLAVIKPDAIERNLHFEIIKRLIASDLIISCCKKFSFTPELIYRFYRHFFAESWERDLIAYLTSGCSIALLMKGRDVINKIKAAKLSIRKEFSPGTATNGRLINLLHTSDSLESCRRESMLIFTPVELSEMTG